MKISNIDQSMKKSKKYDEEKCSRILKSRRKSQKTHKEGRAHKNIRVL